VLAQHQPDPPSWLVWVLDHHHARYFSGTEPEERLLGFAVGSRHPFVCQRHRQLLRFRFDGSLFVGGQLEQKQRARANLVGGCSEFRQVDVGVGVG
jgi:hypothetical protein